MNDELWMINDEFTWRVKRPLQILNWLIYYKLIPKYLLKTIKKMFHRKLNIIKNQNLVAQSFKNQLFAQFLIFNF